jgi:hypothetical protein
MANRRPSSFNAALIRAMGGVAFGIGSRMMV